VRIAQVRRGTPDFVTKRPDSFPLIALVAQRGMRTGTGGVRVRSSARARAYGCVSMSSFSATASEPSGRS
jgi:hypothetical protein